MSQPTDGSGADRRPPEGDAPGHATGVVGGSRKGGANLSALFIRRPIGTSLLAIGLFVIGMLCYFRLGVASLPNLPIPVIFVNANQTGADASTMATSVTAPLERHLGQVQGIDSMRSVSSEASSVCS